MIIAIDGPAASGKSTVAKGVAKALNFTYLDTGAMYRALTLYVIEMKLDLSNENKAAKFAREVDIVFRKEGEKNKVFLNNRDVTDDIRRPDVTKLVSLVSKLTGIRKAMVNKQREYANNKNLVVEGRDIGSVVFPNADVKIFLNAFLKERAHRRQLEWKEKGYLLYLSELETDIERRDRIDSTREDSPLIQSPDAIQINTTEKTADQVIREVTDIARRKLRF